MHFFFFFYRFSTCRAFVQMLNEINDMAGQHELISENLNIHIVKNISILAKELKEDRNIVSNFVNGNLLFVKS